MERKQQEKKGHRSKANKWISTTGRGWISHQMGKKRLELFSLQLQQQIKQEGNRHKQRKENRRTTHDPHKNCEHKQEAKTTCQPDSYKDGKSPPNRKSPSYPRKQNNCSLNWKKLNWRKYQEGQKCNKSHKGSWTWPELILFKEGRKGKCSHLVEWQYLSPS